MPILGLQVFNPMNLEALKGSKVVIFERFSAEIAYFCNYEPLNVGFSANFIPYLKGLYTRDFLSQFLSLKISILWTWGL